MKETLILDVVKDGDEANLAVEYKEDVITLYLDGKKICSMDYQANFVSFLQKALKRWGFAKEYDEERVMKLKEKSEFEKLFNSLPLWSNDNFDKIWGWIEQKLIAKNKIIYERTGAGLDMIDLLNECRAELKFQSSNYAKRPAIDLIKKIDEALK